MTKADPLAGDPEAFDARCTPSLERWDRRFAAVRPGDPKPEPDFKARATSFLSGYQPAGMRSGDAMRVGDVGELTSILRQAYYEGQGQRRERAEVDGPGERCQVRVGFPPRQCFGFLGHADKHDADKAPIPGMGRASPDPAFVAVVDAAYEALDAERDRPMRGAWWRVLSDALDALPAWSCEQRATVDGLCGLANRLSVYRNALGEIIHRSLTIAHAQQVARGALGTEGANHDQRTEVGDEAPGAARRERATLMTTTPSGHIVRQGACLCIITMGCEEHDETSGGRTPGAMEEETETKATESRRLSKATPDDELAAIVRILLASRWVRATVSALSNGAVDSPAFRADLDEQQAIFADLRRLVRPEGPQTERCPKHVNRNKHGGGPHQQCVREAGHPGVCTCVNDSPLPEWLANGTEAPRPSAPPTCSARCNDGWRAVGDLPCPQCNAEGARPRSPNAGAARVRVYLGMTARWPFQPGTVCEVVSRRAVKLVSEPGSVAFLTLRGPDGRVGEMAESYTRPEAAPAESQAEVVDALDCDLAAFVEDAKHDLLSDDDVRSVVRELQTFRNAATPTPGDTHDDGHPHLIGGEFQSDKYPMCPRGKVPLSVKDPTAQDLLWQYAQRRRSVDAEFAVDLETALRTKGYEPKRSPATDWRTSSSSDEVPTARVEAIAESGDNGSIDEHEALAREVLNRRLVGRLVAPMPSVVRYDDAGEGFMVCPSCGGEGTGADRIDGPGDVYQASCPECNGKGRVPRAAPRPSKASLDRLLEAGRAVWTDAKCPTDAGSHAGKYEVRAALLRDLDWALNAAAFDARRPDEAAPSSSAAVRKP